LDTTPLGGGEIAIDAGHYTGRQIYEKFIVEFSGRYEPVLISLIDGRGPPVVPVRNDSYERHEITEHARFFVFVYGVGEAAMGGGRRRRRRGTKKPKKSKARSRSRSTKSRARR
jgi:hypothetical protein